MIDKLDFNSISSDKISLPLFAEKNVEVTVLRLDKMHSWISGNKWFKLRYYLAEAKNLHKKTIITFGGAWSNHLLATAAACHYNNIKSIGVIRGEQPAILSPTLTNAKEAGMQLIFTSREDYAKKKIPEELLNEETYIINEGGYGITGAAGAATILDYCDKENYTHICCATGTGTMMAGIINGAAIQQHIIGISVLKNNLSVKDAIKTLLREERNNFRVFHDYHFGGYAKYKPGLIDFMNSFYQQTKIPSDFVYTGKLFFAITSLINNNFFEPGCRLLLIHSGGLQANASLSKGTLIF